MLFIDRREAGRLLAERLRVQPFGLLIVLAIPRGGVPVGYEISHALGCPFDVVVPRKLPIPWSPEAGFGAIMPDGTRVLNERMVRQLGLSIEEIDRIAAEVLAEVRRRQSAFRGDRPPPDVTGRTVILTDDGLATGYTMIAAVRAIRKQSPSSIIVAVPVSPRDSADEVARDADQVIALHISDEYPFAVASFYERFPDLTDEEVRRYLA
ncbi:MAG: phosphoribosyltransferase [Armatimonadota bacterium]